MRHGGIPGFSGSRSVAAPAPAVAATVVARGTPRAAEPSMSRCCPIDEGLSRNGRQGRGSNLRGRWLMHCAGCLAMARGLGNLWNGTHISSTHSKAGEDIHGLSACRGCTLPASSYTGLPGAARSQSVRLNVRLTATMAHTPKMSSCNHNVVLDLHAFTCENMAKTLSPFSQTKSDPFATRVAHTMRARQERYIHVFTQPPTNVTLTTCPLSGHDACAQC